MSQRNQKTFNWSAIFPPGSHGQISRAEIEKKKKITEGLKTRGEVKSAKHFGQECRRRTNKTFAKRIVVEARRCDRFATIAGRSVRETLSCAVTSRSVGQHLRHSTRPDGKSREGRRKTPPLLSPCGKFCLWYYTIRSCFITQSQPISVKYFLSNHPYFYVSYMKLYIGHIWIIYGLIHGSYMAPYIDQI